jgi:hypothetical protein
MIDDVLPSQHPSAGTFGAQFMRLAEETQIQEEGPISSEGFARFAEFCAELNAILSARLKEISDPAAEIKVLAPVLKKSLSDVGNIAVYLQTGQDNEAMGQLIKLIEILQKLIRLVYYLGEKTLLDLGIIEIGEEGISDFTASLNGHLRELTIAMESADSVLIGDLLEYEIEPRITAFLATLEGSGAL